MQLQKIFLSLSLSFFYPVPSSFSLRYIRGRGELDGNSVDSTGLRGMGESYLVGGGSFSYRLPDCVCFVISMRE